jgi:hypothetical protein
MEGTCSSEVVVTPSKVHGVITEKNTILIDAVLKTLYLYDLLSVFYYFDVPIVIVSKLQYN